MTSKATGAPIAGVQVSTQPATSTATTDATGNYQINAPTGNYIALFSAAGYNADFAGVFTLTQSGASVSDALVPIPANTSMDLYSRPDQAGLGTASDGHTYTDDLISYPSAKASISGRRLFVQTATQITDYDNWMGASYPAELVSVDFNMVTVVQDPSYQHGPRLLANVEGGDTWIEVAVNEIDGTLALWVADANSWTELTEVPLATTTGQWYHSKLLVKGTTVSAKVWRVGTAEPGWQITATQSILTGSGQGGLRTTASDVYYQNFNVILQ